MNKIWIGSPTDVRQGKAAGEALTQINDSQYWDDEQGIVKVSEARWQQAQKFESEGWLTHWRNAVDDRNDEHKRGFNGYIGVPQNLGKVIEIGCGPFTQLKTIQEGRKIETVTLLDPLLEKYMQLPKCTYKSSSFMGHPTTLQELPAEQLRNIEDFDTAICINVLEHVQDVPTILNALHRCLRPGGILIFGERVYDGLNIKQIYDVGHPIRVKMKVFLEWEKQFRSRYQINPKAGDPLRQEHYFIGTKNA